MKHHTQAIRYALLGLSLCGAFAICGAATSAWAQQQQQQTVKPITRSSGERDPFRKYKPPPARVRPAAPAPIVAPTIQERIARYKALKLQAMSAQLPPPKATTALLLNEMQVVGIFRTPRGYAAMVEATPIKLSYVIYPGESFYDGQLVAIEEDRLVFRRETRWTNGRSEKTVETKMLRQPNAVTDSMANTSRAATSTSSANSSVSSSNREQRSSTRDNQ